MIELGAIQSVDSRTSTDLSAQSTRTPILYDMMPALMMRSKIREFAATEQSPEAQVSY